VELSLPPSLLSVADTVSAPELELVSSPLVLPVELSAVVSVSLELVLVSSVVMSPELDESAVPESSGVVVGSPVGSPVGSALLVGPSAVSSPLDDEPPSPEAESSPHATVVDSSNANGASQTRDIRRSLADRRRA
jgi:hypothetical protein